MPDNFFLTGLVLGFSIAAPVGPIGILCIQRTLANGLAIGFISGLGAATADAVYGIIAAFGLTLITNFLVTQTNFLGFAGGLFLCWLGVKTFTTAPTKHAAAKPKSAGGSYGSTFLLTLTNPMTILSFTLIFGGIGLGRTGGNNASAAMLVLGVFSGSGLWWLLLSGGVSLFRRKFDLSMMVWINRFAGLLIVGFGLFALARLVV